MLLLINMGEQGGRVLTLQDKIAGSRRAHAVERAWRVAKSLEENKHRIEGLQWVEPQNGEKGIRRRIDFASEFPDIPVLKPTPMEIGVYAPAGKIVPGEPGMDFAWTMPLLTRIKAAAELPAEVRTALHLAATPSVRPVIDIVSFLPMPRAEAPEEERFKTEFFVGLNLGITLETERYLSAVARYGGRTIDQFAVDGSNLVVLADPKTNTMFSAEMLAGLSPAELAATPENAGVMDIFVYRVSKTRPKRIPDIISVGAGHGTGQDISPVLKGDFGGRGLDYGATKGAGGATRGDSLGFGVIPGGGQSTLPDPSAVPAEVGNVRLGEGTRGEDAQYETFSAAFDPGFPIQPVSIRFLGVREGARESTIRALEQLASA